MTASRSCRYSGQVMSSEIESLFELAAAVDSEEDARELLARPTPAAIRAVAQRADRLRFTHPNKAVGVAAAAVSALARTRANPTIHSMAWAVYGSALRAMTYLEAAQAALMWAARMASTELGKIDTARRLATLRATQGRPAEARAMLPSFLERARRIGGKVYGEELVAAGAIMLESMDLRRAAELTKEALDHLPLHGDSIHLSAVANLCHCQIELAASPSGLKEAERLALKTESLIGDDYTRSKFLWLRARLQQRLGEGEAALETLEAARPEIDATGKPLDRALLLVDLADLQLQLGETEKARSLALESFPLLSQLKTRPEAYKAIRNLQQAAESRALNAEILASIRSDLSAFAAS